VSHNAETTLLTSRELAAMLGLKERTINTRRASGDTPPYLKIGRVVRYRLSDVEMWLAQQVRRSTSDSGNG
jgi:predicted DNA-binding transcriptional regulator AlpA